MRVKVTGLLASAIMAISVATTTQVQAQNEVNQDLGGRALDSALGAPLPLNKPAPPERFELRAAGSGNRASRLFQGRLGDPALGEGVVIFGPSSGGGLTLDLLEQLGSAEGRGIDLNTGGDQSIRNESQQAQGLRDRAQAAAALVAKEPPVTLAAARLRALDKITARLTTLTVPVGSSKNFGNLAITVQTCQKTPPSEPPEDAAFLIIEELTPDGFLEKRFSGWMFASNPAISGLEHPVYDVWVEACTNA